MTTGSAEEFTWSGRWGAGGDRETREARDGEGGGGGCRRRGEAWKILSFISGAEKNSPSLPGIKGFSLSSTLKK